MKEIIIDVFFCIVETIIILYFMESNFNRRSIGPFQTLIPAFLILISADLGVTFLSISPFIQIGMLFALCFAVLCVFFNGEILKKIFYSVLTVLLLIIPSFLIVFIVSWASNSNFSEFVNSTDSLRILTNISIKGTSKNLSFQ